MDDYMTTFGSVQVAISSITIMIMGEFLGSLPFALVVGSSSLGLRKLPSFLPLFSVNKPTTYSLAKLSRSALLPAGG